MPVPEDPGSGSFIVTRIGEIGDTVYRTVLHYRPRAMTGDVVGSLLRPWAEESSREVSVDADVLEAQARAALELPAFLVPLSSAHLGTNGVIWLRRPDDGAASLEWVLIDPVGHPSGRVALPRNVMPRWSDGSTVWAVLTDELDVPWLVRYEMTGG